jgi:acyl CoA:acetate/3-ketoacid CoA transferase
MRPVGERLCTADEAAALVRSGETLAVGGFVGAGVPEGLVAALERRFLREGAPAGITLVYPPPNSSSTSVTTIFSTTANARTDGATASSVASWKGRMSSTRSSR